MNSDCAKTLTCARLNGAVAKALLPLFESSPQHWKAIEFLNAPCQDEDQDFSSYLAAWYRHTPEKHRPIVRKIADLFGVVVANVTGEMA